MENRGDSGWEATSEAYTSEQVSAVLAECGLSQEGETGNDILLLCPFHGNKDTASFSVSKTSGAFICFNASCAAHGTLVELVKRVRKYNEFQARRLIIKNAQAGNLSFTEKLAKAFAPKVDFQEFNKQKLQEMYDTFWQFPPAVHYMVEERGFEEETLHHFKIGYSSAKDLITVPMHAPDGTPIGIIGRPASKFNKAFKNSKNLPTSKTLWNLHRAKRQGDTVIITESSFDAMRVHQAGYPNVVATLGGHISDYHLDQLDKFFSTIVIMTDMDKKHFNQDCSKCHKAGFKICHGHNPGRDLGQKIADKLTRKRILWGSYEPKMVYARGVKDVGDMTDDEIRQCLKNAVPNFVYRSWGLY